MSPTTRPDATDDCRPARPLAATDDYRLVHHPAAANDHRASHPAVADDRHLANHPVDADGCHPASRPADDDHRRPDDHANRPAEAVADDRGHRDRGSSDGRIRRHTRQWSSNRRRSTPGRSSHNPDRSKRRPAGRRSSFPCRNTHRPRSCYERSRGRSNNQQAAGLPRQPVAGNTYDAWVFSDEKNDDGRLRHCARAIERPLKKERVAKATLSLHSVLADQDLLFC